MSDKSQLPCYILLAKKFGRFSRKASSEHYPSHRPTAKEIEVIPGTLLVLIDQSANKKNPEFVFETLDPDLAVQVTCASDEAENVPPIVASLLKPIPTCKERLEVYSDKNWLNDGKKLKPEDSVFVKLKGEQSEFQGVLRFKGEMPDSKGIMFGVQLMESKGNCDGCFRHKRYFQTLPDHAVFAPLHKIRRRRDDWQKNSRLRADGIGEGLYTQRSKIECSLKIGERVVWMSDEGPEKGTVRWIGHLPGEPEDSITVGVDFDRPVGTGTGKYKEERLFFTKQGHASLIPLIGLIKEEEFESHLGLPSDLSENLAPDLTNTTPEIIRQQQIMLEQLSNSAASPGWYDKRNTQGNDGSQNAIAGAVRTTYPTEPIVTGMSSSDVTSYMHDLNMGSRDGAEGSGLNPLYEHTRMQEESNTNSSKSTSSSFGRSVMQEADPDLTIGSLVEVQLRTPLYGVIRWIGRTDESNKLTAGLEMEEELSAGSDGTFKGTRYFTCPVKKALFVPLYRCSKDKRFLVTNRKQSCDFGSQSTPDLHGDIAPPEILSPQDSTFKQICGKNKGIQGHHNSCYLDATLFCMFYFTTVFDFIFNRPPNEGDILEYTQVQQVLREGIVNPLRRYKYVRADKVLQLRALLDQLGTVPGMMSEEKDPEEFLSALLTEIIRADPLLHLSSGEHTYFYQLFMEKDENLLLPTTQKLVELSFLQGNVKLKEVPSCLMIQMPRFGKEFKMFHRIVPSLQLDITDILENCPRDCIVCGSLATHECKDCYQVHGPGLNTTAFCTKCVRRSHQHMSRRNHHPEPIETAAGFMPYYELMKEEAVKNARQNGECDPADVTISLPREKMELFAVICIQTSHYVSFVKCGQGEKAPWVFFDSMADRMGEQGGYNIPEVVHVPDLPNWLSESNFPLLLQIKEDKDLEEPLRRILCDGYMCMYQSPTVMMYN